MFWCEHDQVDKGKTAQIARFDIWRYLRHYNGCFDFSNQEIHRLMQMRRKTEELKGITKRLYRPELMGFRIRKCGLKNRQTS